MRTHINSSTVDGPSGPSSQLGRLSGTEEISIREFSSIQVLEADDSGKDKLVVKLIEKGLSQNRYFYSKKVAESVAGLILDRPKMYLDHGFGWFGRSFRDLTGMARESYSRNGASYAIVEMVNNPETEWLFQFAADHPEDVGASIDAHAKVREATAKDGRLWGEDSFDPDLETTPPTYIVEKIMFLNSVDFVTYASAGGKVVELMASHFPPEAMRRELSLMMESWNNKVAEMVFNSKPDEESDMKVSELTLETLREGAPELVARIEKGVKESFAASAETDDKISDLEKKNATLTTELSEVTGERDELKTKVDEFELREQIAGKRKKVHELVDKSDLDDEHVSETFIADLMKADTDEEIQERIADRQKLVQAASDNGSIEGNGERTPKEGAEEEDEEDIAVISESDVSSLVRGIKSRSSRKR